MKENFAKGLLAFSALSMMVAPASAATIASPAVSTPITATATIDWETIGYPRQTCTLVTTGSIKTAGTFELNEIWTTCPFLSNTIVMSATSTTQVTAAELYLELPFGPCYKSNVPFSWSGSTATLTGPYNVGICKVWSYSVTVTPTVTII